MNNRYRAVLCSLLLGSWVHCDMASGTGGRAIQFDLRITSSPAEFTTSTGWHVKLEQAVVALGPIFIYHNPPPLAQKFVPYPDWRGRFWNTLVPSAHAHAGDEHFFGGEVKGEFLGQIAFDVLNANGMDQPDIPGTLGRAQSASIWLEPPRTSIQGQAAALHGHHAYVVGTAEKDAIVIPFEGGLDIENEGTKRRVDGIPLDMQLDDNRRLIFVVHPKAWFDAAHFDRLVEKNAVGRYVITPESQVRTAWFIGARGFSAFTAEASP